MSRYEKGKTENLSPVTVDEYLEALPEHEREALQRLRNIIKSVVPDAKERISYQIPIVYLNRDLVGFASQKSHCSFYTMSPPLVKKFEEELRSYKISGATIHFRPGEHLPESLIRLILEERLNEMQGK